MTITKVSIRHTLQALVGLALVILPVTIKALKNWPRASDAVQILGVIFTLFTDPRAVFLVKTLLDIFLPEESAGTTIASRFRQAVRRSPKTLQ
jgi:hypothetical protein